MKQKRKVDKVFVGILICLALLGLFVGACATAQVAPTNISEFQITLVPMPVS